MMCQFEGDIVNALYDCFLISWRKEFKNPPGLPCVATAAIAGRRFMFGDRGAYGEKATAQETAKVETHVKTFESHESEPIYELRNQSAHYNKENSSQTSVSLTQRLNVGESPAEETFPPSKPHFMPFYFHMPHQPVPMALVNRRPQYLPGHHDIWNPQNAVWLQGSTI